MVGRLTGHIFSETGACEILNGYLISNRLANKVVKLEDKIKKLEIQNNNLDQYNRRNNVEVSIIPKFVNGKKLENTVVNIFNATDVKISNSVIEACHRFGIMKKKCYCLIHNAYLLSVIGTN